jgi:hypothetical protein
MHTYKAGKIEMIQITKHEAVNVRSAAGSTNMTDN